MVQAQRLARIIGMDVSQFAAALLAIVVIDLVLAGDNAIVIALAARSLPAHLQRRAILWGALGAIVVRSVMTVVVVWLLKIPGLLLAGGLLLLWIAWRLLQPETAADDKHAPAVTTFLGAMRTIVIADAVMGLDNVLAVAGAAHGSYALVVTGLLISVPIVVWGSTLVLKVVQRFPVVVYLGAGVLVATALKMVRSEPLLQPTLATWPMLAVLAWLLVPGLLWLAFLNNHRVLASRIHTRLADFSLRRPAAASGQPAPHLQRDIPGDKTMLNVLVPVDGTPNALLAVRYAIDEYRQNHDLVLHLLSVQPQLSRHVARFLARGDRAAWHQAQADAALAGPAALLQQQAVPFERHWCVGHRAEQICAAASRLAVHHIVMGTARKNSLTRMLQDSVTNQVLEATPVPVEVVAGAAISRWERWGLPAGVGLGVGSLLLLALD